MKYQLLLFEEILRGNLRPWLDANKCDEKFVPLLGDITAIAPRFAPSYEFDFYRFFNARTRYYHKLITSEANNFCNQLLEHTDTNDDSRIIKYRLGVILKKRLPTLLKDVAKLIKANNYDLSYINPHKINPSLDADFKTEAYTIQLLKTALVKVYLEVQELFKSYLPDNYTEIEDLYLQFLSEPIPENSFLKRASQSIELQQTKPKDNQHIELKTANTNNKSFTYNNLHKNPDALKDLLNSLKLHQLIDEKTTIYDFKRIFSGEDTITPIIWTGNVSDLYYFIVLIHNEYKTVKNISPYHWQATANCFIKSDGSTFDTTQLKTQKKPKQNAHIIEKVASHLN